MKDKNIILRYCKMVSLFAVLCIMLVSCSSGGGNLGDALNEALQNVQVEDSQHHGQTSQSAAPDNTSEQSGNTFDNSNNTDYSAFNALVRSYRKARSSSYGELTSDYMGYFYANLIDLNADDVYELVIARVHNSDTEGSVDEMFDPASDHFIGSQSNNYVHVYYLNEDGTAAHAGEFPLSYYGEEGMQFNIEYTEVEGRNYLAFGGDYLDFGITSSDYVFAKSVMSFNGEYFEMAKMFSIQYDYQDAGYEPTEYRQDMEPISEQEFSAQFDDKWFANPTQHTFVAQGYATNSSEVTQATIDFLNGFELKDTHGDAFTYSNGNFVIYELDYIGEDSVSLKHLLDAITYHDFASTQPYIVDETVIKGFRTSREEGLYYPGLIVEEVELLEPEQYSWEDVQIMQYILEGGRLTEMYNQNGLENTFILKVEAKEIIDMEVVQYAGQFGLNVTQYYMFETDRDGNNPKLLASFDDNFFWGYSEVFEVAYITDYEQIFNAYGYEYPTEIMQMYFTGEEIGNMSSYITEDAKEVYFIRNLWGGTMRVYENYIDENEMYARGELLYETSAAVLYLACSSDHVQDSMIYTDVQVVTEPFDGFETVYYPSISHPDSWVNVGVYAKEMEAVS